ncbi:amidase [Microtetraspora malaysiensis]|uniref:amidase n=1 Tax=Microtetraspora malaysiensis TaxID=161358 RepID=UPI003D8BED04
MPASVPGPPAAARSELVSARHLADALVAGELSAREVLDSHLATIEATNPQVNAIVTLDGEGARRRAAQLDALHATSGPVGPLHGLPVAIKDTHPTAGMRTTFGSPVFADHVPQSDALIVDRLKRAGAIVVGKTNTPEFAAGSQTYNAVFGATRNPHDLTKTAGGSSGGSAAAVACGMVALADGSDLGGSLRNPASFCNVVGMRPSPGRVPMWPAWNLWDTCAVQGPMARSVADVALAMSVISGPSRMTPTSYADRADFAAPLDVDTKGLKVGFVYDLAGLPVEPRVVDVLQRAQRVFGETLDGDCRVRALRLDGAVDVFRTLRAAMFAARYGHLIGEPPGVLGDDVRWNIEQGLALSGLDLTRAQVERGRLYRECRDFFEEFDVLVTYTSQALPFDVETPYPRSVAGVAMRDYLEWMGSCAVLSVLETPIVAVPAGFTSDGLPVGVQIMGAPGDDLRVLQVAHAFETARGDLL